MTYSFVSDSAEKTQALGAFLTAYLRPGDVIALEGDLGAGKTTFTAGVAKALHVQDDVISPTFNILKCYFKADIPLYHIDAYRLEGQNIELGLEEYIEDDGICLIEWPIYIASLIPPEHLTIIFHHLGENQREIILSSEGERFSKIISLTKETFR